MIILRYSPILGLVSIVIRNVYTRIKLHIDHVAKIYRGCCLTERIPYFRWGSCDISNGVVEL